MSNWTEKTWCRNLMNLRMWWVCADSIFNHAICRNIKLCKVRGFGDWAKENNYRWHLILNQLPNLTPCPYSLDGSGLSWIKWMLSSGEQKDWGGPVPECQGSNFFSPHLALPVVAESKLSPETQRMWYNHQDIRLVPRLRVGWESCLYSSFYFKWASLSNNTQK